MTDSHNGRWETDALGDVFITPRDALWGTTTQRAINLFPISGQQQFPELLEALAQIKLAAARANMDCEILNPTIGAAIVQAATQVISDVREGQHLEWFPVDPVAQMGAGTSINMNMNEVLANLADLALGGRLDSPEKEKKVKPNDHVNMGQSTNDVIPTTIRLAVLQAINTQLRPALAALVTSLLNKAEQFAPVVKAARTHMMDAVGTTLGNEFAGYAEAIHRAAEQVIHGTESLKVLGIGGTAAGTGVNAHPDYRERVIAHLRELTGIADLTGDPNLFAAMQSSLPFAIVSSTLRNLAIELGKVASDLILLNSGPNTGLSELSVPEVAPGSSIMPGKVNPSMAEGLIMICHHAIGCDTAVAYNARLGQLDLNVLMPGTAYNLLAAVQYLSRGIDTFQANCVDGIEVTPDHKTRCEQNFRISGAAATIMNPLIGYKRASLVTHTARHQHRPIRDVIVELEGEETARKFDELLEAQTSKLVQQSQTLVADVKRRLG